MVGALQYVTLTRNKVCQLMAKLLDSYWAMVKRILRYLKGTLFHGLHFRPASRDHPLSLKAFCDVDWVSDLDDRRSTSRADILLGPNLISCDLKNSKLLCALVLRKNIKVWLKLLMNYHVFLHCLQNCRSLHYFSSSM